MGASSCWTRTSPSAGSSAADAPQPVAGVDAVSDVVVADDSVDSVGDVMEDSELSAEPAIVLLSREQAVRPWAVAEGQSGCWPGCFSCHASRVETIEAMDSSTQLAGPITTPSPRSARLRRHAPLTLLANHRPAHGNSRLVEIPSRHPASARCFAAIRSHVP